jgi:hypothetical protein
MTVGPAHYGLSLLLLIPHPRHPASGIPHPASLIPGIPEGDMDMDMDMDVDMDKVASPLIHFLDLQSN